MRKFSITLLLCQLTVFGSCQPQLSSGQPIIIPMDMTTRRPVVEIMINGKGPYRFILDTGSSTNVIDEALNKEFGFKVIGEDPLMTPGSDSKLVSKRVEVPKVSFPGTVISKDAEMNVIAIRSMVSVDGVLGGFFLEEYLVTLDYPSSKLMLSKGELNKDSKDVIAFVQAPRVINLSVDVGGNSMEAHLDTGNPGAFTLPYSLREKLKFKAEPVSGSPIRTPVASFNRWDAELVGNITIGNIVYENPKVILAEGFEFVNLGYEVIKDMRTTIDRKNNLIRFEKTAKPGSGNESETFQTSPFSGNYEGDRKIWLDASGNLLFQRAGSPIAMQLNLIEGDLYEMKLPEGVRSPVSLPKLRFVQNAAKEIIGIEFIHDDGRKDGPFKKIVN